MSLPTPNTRKEQYLNAIATGNAGGLPTPITREEEYLDAIAKSGGGSGEGDMKKSVYDSDLAVANAGGIGAFVDDAISGKVDKVEGKGLSTNDYDNTEKGKVADNTSAIAAIVNEYGAKNLLPNNATSQTSQGITFTVNADGTITANGTPSMDFPLITVVNNFLLKAGSYILSSGLDSTSVGYMELFDSAQTYSIISTYTKQGGEALFTLNADTYVKACAVIYMSEVASNIVFYPMIRDARITDSTYVPYAMTNRELTENVSATKNTQTVQYGSIRFIKSGELNLAYVNVNGIDITEIGEQIISFDTPSGFEFSGNRRFIVDGDFLDNSGRVPVLLDINGSNQKVAAYPIIPNQMYGSLKTAVRVYGEGIVLL